MHSTALKRCPWLDERKPDYVVYHDQEWGVPVYDDAKIFEYLTLESAQAGLSWYTVLKKRENYRQAFAGFQVDRVARFGTKEIERLLQNAGIIRNRLKIAAAISNAQRFQDIQREFGSFSKYMWDFVDGRPKVNRFKELTDFPATSPESDRLSKDLKSRGFKFVGSTICYAHMQATGMINDHTLGCFRRDQIIASYSD
jgi:DNA-3-methyladenine glycosylase I